MKKGIILEINDRYLTLLTPQGEFLRARKLQQDYQLGEEIHFFPEVAAVKRKKFNLSILNGFKARTLALSAALMLMLAVFLPSFQNAQVYAYMSIDVNPSVELELNDDMKVLNIKGYNKDGKKIIASISDWEKKDAAIVADMILDEFEDEGYLFDNKEIVLATAPAGKTEEKADKKLKKKIAEIKKTTSKDHLELKVVHGTAKEREQARKKGLTTGLYKEKLKETKKPSDKPSGQEKKDIPKKSDTPVNEGAKKQENKPLKGKSSENPSQSKKTPDSSNNKQKPSSSGDKSGNWKSGQSKDNLYVKKNIQQKEEKSKSKQDKQNNKNKQIRQQQTFKHYPPGQAKKFKD